MGEASLGTAEAALATQEAGLGSCEAARCAAAAHPGAEAMRGGSDGKPASPRRLSAAAPTTNLVTGVMPGFIGTTCCTQPTQSR